MKKLLGSLKIYGIMFIGALCAALGVSLFLAPVGMVAGGLSGIGIMVRAITGFPVGILMLLLNIPLFLLAFRSMGITFLYRSLFGAFFFSLLTDITALIPTFTKSPILCALFGGALLGIGMGIVFLFGATTGGTDIVAQLLHKKMPTFDIGKWLLLIDGCIILLSGFVFNNFENCLYGIIAATASSLLIDTVIQGANFAKIVYVISPKSKEIAQEIMDKLSRGVTGIYGKGMFSNCDTVILMSVIKKNEIPKLEKIVLTQDPNAFIIFTGARSVSGEGFKVYPIN